MVLLKLIQLLLLIKVSAGVNLECEFKEISDVTNELYTCKTSDLATTEFDNYVTEISGSHADGKTNDDVKQLIILDQKVEFFPGGLRKFFPALEAIKVDNSSLRYIFKADLAGLSNLKYFTIKHNEIETLGSKLFEGNPKLIEIHLEKNKLSSISEDLLDPFEETPKVVHLFGNKCIVSAWEAENPTTSEMKEIIKSQCPLSTEDSRAIFEKEVEKLLSHVKNLEDVIEDKKDASKLPSTPDENLKETEKLQSIIDTLKFEKTYFENNISLATQSLEENAIELKALSEKNENLQFINSNLEANLTEHLQELKDAREETKELELLVDKATEELTAEKVATKSLQAMLSETKSETAEIGRIFEKLQEKFETANEELQKAKVNFEKLEKSTKSNVAALNSVNRELRKLNTLEEANKAHYEFLKQKEAIEKKKAKKSIKVIHV